MTGAIVVTCGCLALGALLSHGAWRSARVLTAYTVVGVAEAFFLLAVPAAATPAAFVGLESILAALRFGVAIDVADYVARHLPGIKRRVWGLTLALLICAGALAAFGYQQQASARDTYRGLALASSGAGMLLLLLRVQARRHGLDLPRVLATTTPLGVFLMAHGMLLGAATEAAHVDAAASASTLLWSAWAIWLAVAAWRTGAS